MYTEKAMDHFTNPRNVGVLENDFIKDIKFKVHGCAGAISTSSMVTGELI